MLTAQENSVTVFSKAYTDTNRISGYGYDIRGNLTQDESFAQVWDKRNRMTESRTMTNALLGKYLYNERGLRIKAERSGQPVVQVVRPNGGESLYLGAMDTIIWNGMGLAGALVKLELLVGGAVTGTIAENLPGTQTSFQWQVGKTLTGTANPGSDYKVRVTAMVPPVASGTTYYFYDSGGKLLSEYDGSGACVKDYLYLGGKMIGEYLPATSAYYYYASDQINSTRLVTDAIGAVVHSAQYDPYGGLYKTWVDTYHPKPGFSGKEREFGSEMDYFGARYYGHRQYRFLSVDPMINKDEAINNPQLWNLYAYCANNPISRFDPDGRESNFGTHWFFSQGNNAENTGGFIRNHPVAFTTASIAGLAAPFVGPAIITRIISATAPIIEKYGDKIKSAFNMSPELEALYKTGKIFEMFTKGNVETATKTLENMAQTGAGRSELLKIHQTISGLISGAKTVDAVNIMKTIQQITGTLSRGGK